jgi:hypothetical protein
MSFGGNGRHFLPQRGAKVGECETSEMSVICNVWQQIADEKESGQGWDRTGDTRIFRIPDKRLKIAIIPGNSKVFAPETPSKCPVRLYRTISTKIKA